MRYINNINVNFNNELINFYEWLESDNITVLKSIPLYKLNNGTYTAIINNKIQVDKEFLNQINSNICLFCNDYDTICIMFDNEGYSIKYSKLSLDDENKIYKIILKEKTNNLKFKIIEPLKYSFHNREIDSKLKNIIDFIKDNKSNKDMIRYLSLEWFNRITDNYNKLINDVNNSKESEIENMFELIKIIHV